MCRANDERGPKRECSAAVPAAVRAGVLPAASRSRRPRHAGKMPPLQLIDCGKDLPVTVLLPNRVFGKLLHRMHMPSISQTSRIKPRALRPGDKVGMSRPPRMSTAKCWKRAATACAAPVTSPFISSQSSNAISISPGRAERRARELEDMFARDDIRAIVCARGGYGSNYLPLVLDPMKIVSILKFWSATATSRRWCAASPTRPTS